MRVQEKKATGVGVHGGGWEVALAEERHFAPRRKALGRSLRPPLLLPGVKVN